MPKLIFTQPEFVGQSCELKDGTLKLGRSRHNDIILEDDSVSGEHGELLVYGQEVIVRERGSQNGTFVNGIRVQAQSGVNHGQTIRFGRVEVRLDLEPVQDESSTDLTAVIALRRFRSETASRAPEAPRFPVTFAPRKPALTERSTSSLPLPSESRPVPTTLSSTDHTSHSNPHEAKSRWGWLVVGVSVAALIVLWLWRR